VDRLPHLLSRVWHFRHLSAADLRQIVTAGSLRRFPCDVIIFQEGEPAAGMFVLLSGRVNLLKHGPDGKEQIMAVIEPVIMFNELTVMDGGPNPFTATAAVNSLTWNVDLTGFQDLVRRYPDPDIGLGLLKVLAARTRLLINRCEDLSYRPVLSRVAKLLMELSDNGQSSINRRDHPIRELAAHVASVPEVVSRSLSSLDEKGIIVCDRRSIAIVDRDRLTDLVRIGSLPELG
jgi:CRP-like cAMP-binding protein